MKKILLALALLPATFFGSVNAQAGADEILALGRNNQYTFDVLKNAEVAEVIKGALFEEFQYFTATSSPSEVLGDRFLFASGCEPHNCPNEKAFIIDSRRPQAVVILRGDYGTETRIFASEAWNLMHGGDNSVWPYVVRARIERWKSQR